MIDVLFEALYFYFWGVLLVIVFLWFTEGSKSSTNRTDSSSRQDHLKVKIFRLRLPTTESTGKKLFNS
jgi:hypothetical protein